MASKTKGAKGIQKGKRSSTFADEMKRDAERDALKQAKHNAAILKKQGLLTENYNVRGMSKVSRYLKDKFKEFSGVLKGDQKGVKLKATTPTAGIKTVKVGRNTVGLVNIAGKKEPKIFVTSKGVTVIDKIFGTHIMEDIISVDASTLLTMSMEEKKAVFSKYSATKSQSFVAYLSGGSGEAFITRESFASVESLVSYLERYMVDNPSFGDVMITLRIQNDADINSYRAMQRKETDKRKQERERDRKRNMTTAQRAKVNERERDRKRNMTTAQRAKVNERRRASYAAKKG